jgi:LL-diaminopimelate aminotransferase
VQLAGITALESDQSCVQEMQAIYQERRDVLIRGLREVGLRAEPPKATFYVWCPTPPGMTSAQFTSLLLKQAGIVTTPGSGFGAPGEGYVRMALTVSKERIQEAVERIRKVSF